MMKMVAIVGGFIAAVALTSVLSVSGLSATASAADSGKTTKEQTAKKAATVKDYTYTASAGDSYTVMVRKAVQTYGINNKVKLGNARIVYIETMMTQMAGSPDLWVGQKVTIAGSDVKSWADKSLKLSNEDVAAWQTYVQFVDFNTNNVGKGE